MALPDSAKLTIGTYLLVADSTDYADNQGFGTRTDQIDLTSLAAGAARQSAKLDFTANMDLEYVWVRRLNGRLHLPLAKRLTFISAIQTAVLLAQTILVDCLAVMQHTQAIQAT